MYTCCQNMGYSIAAEPWTQAVSWKAHGEDISRRSRPVGRPAGQPRTLHCPGRGGEGPPSSEPQLRPRPPARGGKATLAPGPEQGQGKEPDTPVPPRAGNEQAQLSLEALSAARKLLWEAGSGPVWSSRGAGLGRGCSRWTPPTLCPPGKGCPAQPLWGLPGLSARLLDQSQSLGLQRGKSCPGGCQDWGQAPF